MLMLVTWLQASPNIIRLTDYAITNDSTQYKYNTLVLERMLKHTSGTGKTILVEGIVWLDTLTLHDIDSVMIVGGNNATFVFKGYSDRICTPFWLHNCDNWTIDGVTFNCRDSQISNKQHPIIFWNSAFDIKIYDCTFIDCSHIRFYNTQRVRLKDNTCINPTAGLFYCWTPCKAFVVADNIYYGNNDGFAFASGHLSNSIINNNYIEYTDDSSIYFFGRCLQITNNIIVGAGKDAIKNLIGEHEDNYSVISNNIIDGAGLKKKTGGVAINNRGVGSLITDNLIIAWPCSMMVAGGTTGIKTVGSKQVTSSNVMYGTGQCTSGTRINQGSEKSVVNRNTYFDLSEGIYTGGKVDSVIVKDNLFIDCKTDTRLDSGVVQSLIPN
jgi:hypothetical protein